MKRFLNVLVLFCLPFVLFFVYGMFGYEKSGGDLNRLGKISISEHYRDTLLANDTLPKLWTNFSEIDRNLEKGPIDVLIIGDSFSNQGTISYYNFLASIITLNVFNFDYNAFNLGDYYNPIQLLFGIKNSGLIEEIKPKCIVLEIVERNVIEHFRNLDHNLQIDKAELKDRLYSPVIEPLAFPVRTFFNDIVLYYRYGFFYKFNDHAYESQVYKLAMSDTLFSSGIDDLIFFEKDLINMHNTITEQNIELFNDGMNMLNKELESIGINLIVLVCPDKYDMYQDYIVNNRHPKNPFFDILRSKNKTYDFIDTKTLFMPYLEKGIKDLYFADDTHWSPIASKIVAQELNKVIGQNE
ncbi:alginate O-acetyltransferase AlgX-related protein [Aestuariivivens marinum]|uniref:alginate O-acetyltransferase AlgX-related protein n=1 Tax=Aestuariivivens marinum TaxID=2913555 RepID=UPI001F591A58|nr:hypothetical protein [Aestuariivivens marinum]